MISSGNAGQAGPLFLAGIALLGLILSPFAEGTIAKLLPRVGGLPSARVRIMTAALTAVLCGAFAFRFGAGPALPAFILLVVLGVQLARIDVVLHLLPNSMVLALLVGGFLCLLGAITSGEQGADLLRGLAGAGILFVIYLILALISPAGLGMGDVKLAAPVGLYLGYVGWAHLLYGGLLGFIIGGAASAVLLRLNRGNRPDEVAFGPSMLLAAIAITLVPG